MVNAKTIGQLCKAVQALGKSLTVVFTCWLQVNRLTGQPQSLWDMKSVREVLQLSGINMAALLERHEVMTACQQQLDKMPKPVGMALLTPSTSTLTAGDCCLCLDPLYLYHRHLLTLLCMIQNGKASTRSSGNVRLCRLLTRGKQTVHVLDVCTVHLHLI